MERITCCRHGYGDHFGPWPGRGAPCWRCRCDGLRYGTGLRPSELRLLALLLALAPLLAVPPMVRGDTPTVLRAWPLNHNQVRVVYDVRPEGTAADFAFVAACGDTLWARSSDNPFRGPYLGDPGQPETVWWWTPWWPRDERGRPCDEITAGFLLPAPPVLDLLEISPLSFLGEFALWYHGAVETLRRPNGELFGLGLDPVDDSYIEVRITRYRVGDSWFYDGPGAVPAYYGPDGWPGSPFLARPRPDLGQASTAELLDELDRRGVDCGGAQ